MEQREFIAQAARGDHEAFDALIRFGPEPRRRSSSGARAAEPRG